MIKPILKRAVKSRRKILKGTEDAREPMSTPRQKGGRSTTTKEERSPETENAAQSDPLSPVEVCTGVDSKTPSQETSQELSSANFQHDAQKFYKAILSDIFLE